MNARRAHFGQYNGSFEGSRENDGKMVARNGCDSLGEFISRRRKVIAPKGRGSGTIADQVWFPC